MYIIRIITPIFCNCTQHFILTQQVMSGTVAHSVSYRMKDALAWSAPLDLFRWSTRCLTALMSGISRMESVRETVLSSHKAISVWRYTILPCIYKVYVNLAVSIHHYAVLEEQLLSSAHASVPEVNINVYKISYLRAPRFLLMNNFITQGSV